MDSRLHARGKGKREHQGADSYQIDVLRNHTATSEFSSTTRPSKRWMERSA